MLLATSTFLLSNANATQPAVTPSSNSHSIGQVVDIEVNANGILVTLEKENSCTTEDKTVYTLPRNPESEGFYKDAYSLLLSATVAKEEVSLHYTCDTGANNAAKIDRVKLAVD